MSNTPTLLQVQTTCPTQTSESGVILPAGAYGRILDYQQGKWILDFGLARVVVVPINSPLLKIVRGVVA